MKAEAIKFLDFIAKAQDTQFVIPVYQRIYSWDIKQCLQLWEDILKIGQSGKIEGHFIGSIVFVANDIYQVGHNELLVIDGQQRLTTITLLLIALRNILQDKQEILGKFSAIKIDNRYLINRDEENERKYKLILSENDKDTLLALIDKDRREPNKPSSRITDNFIFFEKVVLENKDKLEQICIGLEKLMIVSISLERGKDNPQLIFESMNSTGKNLTQTNLIRNYILMGLESKEQNRLYEKYWRAMELAFPQDKLETYFNAFVRHYLTLKTQDIPNISRVYEAFKIYQQESGIDIETLLQDLQKYCDYFCCIAFQKEQDNSLSKAFGSFLSLKTDTAYPMLLELYNDYADNILSKQDFICILSLIESYIFRRAVCGIGTNGLNKTFSAFLKNVKKAKYLESVQAQFLLFQHTRIFPNDNLFRESFIRKDFYGFALRSYAFLKLENFERKEKVNIDEYTIEHIMPQNENLSLAWQKDLGENYKDIHEKYLHTIGNLTLTGYNSEYGDKSFKEKRDMKGGFKESPLRLNENLRNLENWNESEILKRANALADLSLKIWIIPSLDETTYNTYKPKIKQQYDLSNYHFSKDTREIFDILRKGILAFDENITENFTKQYIAYKLNTNFVDVVVLKSELKLYLNIDIFTLQDEKKIARDVTNVGTWGNGDVEIKLSSKSEIPYCLGLIRQALERQLD
ncbi:DUF262 and DUF1524 domain-containing protein [uncultured Helicobacter sp.]|uniref:DUF262 and DUF1524 domain-containing protein n=1 Tax=uncultured Helicobacter sp. TaxID=175537 RepID=UPI00262AFC50|nr:DUF262 and DUF1524 domain-containing protein [uncultured Helicobacter sp.]